MKNKTSKINLVSKSAVGKLDYTEPRTIWILGFQLLYTIIAMIPIYYYLTEILTIRAEARNFVIYMPLATGLLLFFIQLKLNSYFWTAEKTYLNRDIFVTSTKSVILVIFEFYIIFLYFFGYFLSDTETYQRAGYQNELSKLMFEVITTLIVIYFTVVMILNVQSTRFEQVFNRSVSKIRGKR